MRYLLLFMIAVMATGCWNSSKYPLETVAGIVTLDGKPLGDAFVNFQPTGGPGSTAITDAEGRYSLTTIDGDPGAVIGLHNVTVYSVHSQEAASDDETIPRKTTKERVPDKYNYESTLTFDVPAGGSTSADWVLKTSS